MALDVRVDSFTKGAVGDQTVTVGFQPKVIKFWVEATVALDTWAPNSMLAIGLATGPTNQFCVPSHWQNNAGTAARAIIVADENGVVLAQGYLKEFNATGFVITWEVSGVQAFIIHYEAIGGSDLTGAYVRSVSAPSGAGAFDIDGAPFTPTFAYFLVSGGPIGDEDLNPGASALSIGCANITNNQWAVSFRQLFRVSSQLNCMAILPSFGSTPRFATFSQFNSDGCKVIFNTAATGVTRTIITLFLQGPAFAVNSFAKPTSTSVPVTQVFNILGLTPKLVSMATIGAITAEVPQPEGMLSIGSMDATRARAIARTAATTPENKDSIARNRAIMKANASAAEQAVASLVSLDANGWTLSWTTNDAFATLIYFYGLGTIGTPLVKTRSSDYRILNSALAAAKQATYRVRAATAVALASTYRIISTTEVDESITGYGGRRYGTQWGECSRCGFFYPFPLLIIQPGDGGGMQVCTVRCLDTPSVTDMLPDELPTEQPLQFIGDAGPEE